MTGLRSQLAPALATLILALVAATLAWPILAPDLGRTAIVGYDISQMVFLHSTLPRMAVALIAGAALALSGALFQQVLRNPLASPTTLGISAGANLSLVLALLFVPGLIGAGRDLVALAGSAAAAAIVLGLGARRGFSPFSLVLAGLVVNLWCGALAAILTLLNDRYLVSLFIWGAGSLAQQSWDVALSLFVRLLVLAGLAALALRPLALLELGDSGATALGLNVRWLRIFVIAVALSLSAFVTSAVGVIGFIGLVAPILCRLLGVRRPVGLLIWSSLIGALLLLVADEAVRLTAGLTGEFLPTGAVTAIFGAPLLLTLLPQLRLGQRPAPLVPHPERSARPVMVLVIAGLACALALAIGLLVGHGPDGSWTWLDRAQMLDILPLRLPRVFAALASGAMFSVAGVILQRLTGNEMASPEVLGVSAGATLGVTLSLFLLAATPLASQLGFAALGAFAVLAVLFLTSARSGFAAERVLLGGIALGSLADAVVGALSATGDPRALQLMRWMSGSTYLVDAPMAASVSMAALLLVVTTLALRRWLDLLPLGGPMAGSLGVPIVHARLGLFGLAGLLSAAATLSVGPLSFIGLMGPHLAREAGMRRALPQTLAAALLGGGLMVLADWLGRNLAFPYQVPAGLVSALIGAPVLMVLLRRSS